MFTEEMMKNAVYSLTWKRRIKLILRGLLCQVQYVTYYGENGKKLMTGWLDWKTNILFITWFKEQ